MEPQVKDAIAASIAEYQAQDKEKQKVEKTKQQKVAKLPSYLSDKHLYTNADDLAESVITSLPSKSLSYQEGVVVKVRPYTWSEITYLSNAYVSSGDKYQFILKGICVEGMDVLDLTFADFKYLLFVRKIVSFGHESFTFSYICTGCGKSTSSKISSKALSFSELDIKALPIRCVLQETELEISPMTLRDYFNLLSIKEYKSFETSNTAVFATMCHNISYADAYKVIHSCTSPAEIEALIKIDSFLFHQLDPVKCTCKECSKENSIVLDSEEAILIPFRLSTGDATIGISFG